MRNGTQGSLLTPKAHCRHGTEGGALFPLLPPAHPSRLVQPQFTYRQNPAEMLSHHFPLHRYQGTFQKDLEGQLQEFQGNMLYRAL